MSKCCYGILQGPRTCCEYGACTEPQEFAVTAPCCNDITRVCARHLTATKHAMSPTVTKMESATDEAFKGGPDLTDPRELIALRDRITGGRKA